MTFAFDLPNCPPSLVQRLDPRWKLASVLLAAMACAWLRTTGPALTALAATLALVALTRLPVKWYVRRLSAALTMFAIFLIWLPFVVEEGHATYDLGFVTISLTGLLRWIVLSVKLTALISWTLVLLATTSVYTTFKAAGALHIPRLLVMLLLLTYRYVFLLVEEFGRLRTALRVRGFRNRADLHSYRTIGQVAGTLLVRSHERSERVAHAMQARGFDGQFRTLDTFSTRPADVAFFALVVLGAAGLVAWDWQARAAVGG